MIDVVLCCGEGEEAVEDGSEEGDGEDIVVETNL
jgi:hypothetical protein